MTAPGTERANCEIMRLFRPVGTKELGLIKESGMVKFPPRLPDQPIFYPVLNLEYARQIAKDWNATSAPDYTGFITEFDVDDEYIKRYEVKTVGSSKHQELWIPAEEIELFNNNIVGLIKVIEVHYGNQQQKDKTFTSMKSLMAIKNLKSGDMMVLKQEKWLMYLALTTERNVNLERLDSMEELKNNYVLNYVERTLQYLERFADTQSGFKLEALQSYIIEETLKWCEVAKSGMAHQRRKWSERGYNLHAHNLGSAMIYQEQTGEPDPIVKKIVYSLISTHGLVGQYIRGEVKLAENEPLYRLVAELGREHAVIGTDELRKLLLVLNYCIICAVDEHIWEEVGRQCEDVIGDIATGRFDKQYSVKERIRRLRKVSISNGENFEEEYARIFNDRQIARQIADLLENRELWYVEPAMYDFSFSEFIKIFLLIAQNIKDGKVKHISLERLMNNLYYQHDGKKRINIYKKRIIEKYLADITFGEILSGTIKENLHVRYDIAFADNTGFFTFRFSPAGEKLIEFCVEAERSDVLYENAVLLSFDLFGLRKDKYDRFYEEERYLKTMNQSIDFKKVILDYITGASILDIGPGGGAMMDLIEERYPDKTVNGVDISQNVLDALKKKKQLEQRKWDVIYGDALNLGQYVQKGGVDTIIYCSILHELFSYIEYNGKKFNHDTLATALKSGFDILPAGGRIIIRDGIMTEPEDQKRIIRFLSEEGMEFLKRYAGDFKGRQIEYSDIGRNEVIMPVNDAMEFLYTYTWGEKSYVHEVNEQFGYFTPGGYRDFIYSTLGEHVKTVDLKHFLQDGYTVALSPKIEFFDENRNPVRLPDSTCIIIIEKT